MNQPDKIVGSVEKIFNGVEGMSIKNFVADVERITVAAVDEHGLELCVIEVELGYDLFDVLVIEHDENCRDFSQTLSLT